MVEKAGLPVRIVISILSEGGGERLFQKSDGCAQSMIPRWSNEQMDVIGHDDIVSDGGSPLGGSHGERKELIMNGVVSQHRLSIQRAEGYEEQRRVVWLKNRC